MNTQDVLDILYSSAEYNKYKKYYHCSNCHIRFIACEKCNEMYCLECEHCKCE
jgi:hypothetical protein